MTFPWKRIYAGLLAMAMVFTVSSTPAYGMVKVWQTTQPTAISTVTQPTPTPSPSNTVQQQNAAPLAQATLTDLTVADTEVVKEGNVIGTTTGNCWSYDAASNTLTLTDANITGVASTNFGAGIYAEGDLTIVLEGSSTITGVQPSLDANSGGLIVRNGNLTVIGDGSLTVNADDGKGSNQSYAIQVDYNMTQQGGSITCNGGNGSFSYGMYLGKLTVHQGSLTACGGTATNTSYGIYMDAIDASVTVSDATVTATGGTGKESYGLYIVASSPSVTISDGGSLTARSETATSKVGGIYVNNFFGSTGSVTVGDNSTLLTNSVILYDNSFTEKPLAPTGEGSWLIYGQTNQTSTIQGNVQLPVDVTIPSGVTLAVHQGNRIEVPANKTMTVEGTLTIDNTDCITGEGTLNGNGKFIVNPIVTPTSLTYNAQNQFDALSLQFPEGSVIVLGKEFTKDGWSIDPVEMKNVGDYELTIRQGTITTTKTVTIEPAPLTVTGVTADSRDYNDSNIVTISGVTLAGAVAGETVEIEPSSLNGLTGTLDSANAGTYKELTLTGTVALAGSHKDNYTLTLPAEGVKVAVDGGVTINKVASDIAFNNYSHNKTYDGQPLATPTADQLTITNGSYENVTFTWYKDSVQESNKLDAAPTNAGSYVLVASLPDSTNTTANSATSNITIEPAPITITANPQSKTYGDTDPTFSYDIQGKPQQGTPVVGTLSRMEGENVGKYTLQQGTLTNENNPNYSISFVESQLEITPKPLTITWNYSQPFMYDGTKKSVAATVNGALNQDSVEVTYAPDSVHAATNAGNYTAKVQGVNNGNYVLSSDAQTTLEWGIGVVSLEKATVTLNKDTFVYNGKEQTPTVTVMMGQTKLIQDVDYTVTMEGDTTNVGTVQVKVVGKGNYEGSPTSQVGYQIQAATPTIVWTQPTQKVTYNGNTAVIAAPTVTLVNNEAFTGEILYQYKQQEAAGYTKGLPTNAGTYLVRAYIQQQGNYTAATSNEMTLTIEKASPTITPPSAAENLVYNAQPQQLVVGGSVTDGELRYSMDAGGEFTTAIPTATNAGNYIVYFKAVATDENHLDSEVFQLEVDIAKAEPTEAMTKASGKVMVGNSGSLQLPALPDGASYGTPSTQDSQYITGLKVEQNRLTFTGTNAVEIEDTYTITLPVTGATNYKDYTITIALVGTDKYVPDLAVQPLTRPYNGKAISLEELTKTALYEGTEVEGTWTFQQPNQAPKNAGDYTVELLFTPKDSQYTQSTVAATVSIEKLDATIGIQLSSNRVALSENLPTATLSFSGVLEGESLAPQQPSFEGMPSKGETGTFVIALSNGTKEAVQALETAQNYNLSYTNISLTVADVTLLPTTDNNHRLELTQGVPNIPQSIVDAGYDTEEKITEKLFSVAADTLADLSKNNLLVYDIALYVSEDGGHTWSLATKENFPQEGISVTLPYPTGITGEQYDFVVTHMFHETMNNYKAGDVETLAVTETAQGLQFTIASLSPVAMGWSKTTVITPTATPAPTSAPTTQPTAQPTAAPTQTPAATQESVIVATGDTTNLLLWGGLLGTSLLVVVVLHKGKQSKE